MAGAIVDDKSEHCVPFILKRIKAHQESYKQAGKEAPPFFLGLNGVQGAGKTTLVSSTSRLPFFKISETSVKMKETYLKVPAYLLHNNHFNLPSHKPQN